ncbi:cytochrome b5 domain-containing protein [Vallitalea guaymasensis]|uniref:cytochrome b5 domain-containing protein n=1 Tax=Vallitalea guaymasensis TaxID=1185412 RepID=UPI001FA93D0F|nr:cytochrome b5 domain-containing protein [Vallitalea guaymasensis]
MYYVSKIEEELFVLDKLLEQCYIFLENMAINETSEKRLDRTFTIEELKEYNGEKGRPAYIAVDGVVYDVTYNPSWGGGTHFGVVAGKDITDEFNKCHGGENVLTQLEVVGKIIEG